MQMREILFRGKRTDNGEWAVGLLTKRPSPIQIGNMSPWFIAVPPAHPEDDGGFHNVDPETVGQYTGLKAGGKRIFEGDVVKRCFTLHRSQNKKTRECQVGVVRYIDSECGFALENVCNLRKPWDGDTLEIIGNIHDNPELLEGGADG